MTPSISIIMGAYNAQKTIDKAIDSILKQSFTDWEFIICDDASTDDTYKSLLKYQSDNRFIILKNTRNEGLASTLNTCLTKAQGKYIARQDADDCSYPERLFSQYHFLETHPEIDILGTQADLVNEEGKKWGQLCYPLRPTLKNWIIKSSVIHATVMGKKEVFLKHHGYNPKALRVEDYELWFRMLAKNVKFENLSSSLYQIHWTLKDYGRKKYIDRVREAQCRFKGYRLIKAPLIGYFYILKPLILGLLPSKILKFLHQKLFKTNPA